jgi:hypothetical protein
LDIPFEFRVPWGFIEDSHCDGGGNLAASAFMRAVFCETPPPFKLAALI